MELVKPGRYSAKVIDHAITETRNGDPQAAVRFGFDTDGGYKEMLWFGSFKEKALPHTIKALLACGLKGNNPGGDLTIGQEVSIVVEIDQDHEGKDKNVIRWVNAPGGFGKSLDPVEAKAKLERFSGAVMTLKEKEGLAPKNFAPKGSSHPFDPSNDDGSDPWG